MATRHFGCARSFRPAGRCLGVFALGMALLVATAAKTHAQPSGTQVEAFEGLEVEEHLGEFVPGEIPFKNARGETVRLAQYLEQGRPVLLSLVYHSCPMLCDLMTEGLVRTLKDMDWRPGSEFTVLSVSFNYREGPEIAAEQKRRYLETLGRAGAADGWHFLTGSQASIERLTEAVGFNYRWMEEKQQFAHPAVLVFLSPEGKITRYLYGLERPPRKMRNALVEAGNGTVGNILDQVILYCYQYDPEANAYVAQAFNIMRLGGVVTVLLLGAILFLFWRRESRALDG